MAKIKINGDSSGYVELAAPNAAHNNTLELGPGTKILTDKNTHTGNIGIGTDNPAGILEIDATSTTDMIMLDAAGSNFARLGHNTASGTDILDVRSEGHMRFLTNGNNERIRITSDGRIGIGMNPHTSSTGYALQIDGGASSFIQIFNDTSGNTVNDGLVIGNDANTAYLVNKENTPLVFRTNNTEQLRITSTGNIGIGTITPNTGNPSGAKYLHIHNSSTSNSNSPAEIYFTNANTGPSGGAGGMITFYNSGFYFWNYANDDIHFGTGGSERFKFDHSENILDFQSTSKIRLKGSYSTGRTHAHLNIGSDGAANADTRAIDIWGSWQDQESKSITWNHGTGTSDMVCQQRS